MGRPCTICAHPKRRWIDQAIAKGTPKRRIAVKYGCAETTLFRHEKTHLRRELVEAAEAKGVELRLDRGWSVAEKLLQCIDMAEEGIKTAKRERDKIAWHRELRSALTDIARMGIEQEARRRGRSEDRDVSPAVAKLIEDLEGGRTP